MNGVIRGWAKSSIGRIMMHSLLAGNLNNVVPYQKPDVVILLERIIALESKVQELQLKLKVGEVNPYDQ